MYGSEQLSIDLGYCQAGSVRGWVIAKSESRIGVEASALRFAHKYQKS